MTLDLRQNRISSAVREQIANAWKPRKADNLLLDEGSDEPDMEDDNLLLDEGSAEPTWKTDDNLLLDEGSAEPDMEDE
jgi:hypothetical protein